jgi:hypothetical protein
VAVPLVLALVRCADHKGATMTLTLQDHFGPDEPVMVVCALATEPSLFPDNVHGPCGRCGREVQHRPHIPPAAELICLPCFEQIPETPEDVHITSATLRELVELERQREEPL